MTCYQDSWKKARIVYLKDVPVCVAFVGRVAVLRDRTVEIAPADSFRPLDTAWRWSVESWLCLTWLGACEEILAAMEADMVTEQSVLDALLNVIDPDLGRDIVSLGFVKNLVIADGDVSFTVELTTPPVLWTTVCRGHSLSNGDKLLTNCDIRADGRSVYPNPSE